MTHPRSLRTTATTSISTPTCARSLWVWVAIVTIGEAAGFIFPATVGTLAADSGGMPPLLLAAGALEGSILGLAQGLVLARIVGGLRVLAWTALTATGAVAAYTLGLGFSLLSGVWLTWPWPVTVALGAVLGCSLLVTVGGAQWIELRRRLRGAGWWIIGTAGGWLVGLAFFFAIATPLWHEGQPAPIAISIGIGAGLVMAVAMSVITGVTLCELLKRQP